MARSPQGGKGGQDHLPPAIYAAAKSAVEVGGWFKSQLQLPTPTDVVQLPLLALGVVHASRDWELTGLRIACSEIERTPSRMPRRMELRKVQRLGCPIGIQPGKLLRVRVVIERSLTIEHVEKVGQQHGSRAAHPHRIVGMQGRRVKKRRTGPEAIDGLEPGPTRTLGNLAGVAVNRVRRQGGERLPRRQGEAGAHVDGSADA